MSNTPGNNKQSKTKTPPPVKAENTQKGNRNESEGNDNPGKDGSKSDVRSGKTQKNKS